MTVQADVAPGTQAATVVQALAPKIAALNASLPSGYHIEVGGTVEESSKAQASVAAVLPLMLVLILTVLMIQLQGFSRLFLVLSVAPLGLIGVVAALLLSDKPLGFVALLGVLALTGMIARNSVILIDQIEKEKAQGRHPWDAVVEATDAPLPPDPAHRLRRNPRHDPDRADHLLGSDGLRDHGRSRGRDASDPGLPSGALRDLVPDQATRSAGARRRARRAGTECGVRQSREGDMNIDPALLSPLSALLGALVGGVASLLATIYTQRRQDRIQRIALEVAKRETVYADFVMNASNFLLHAYTRDDIVLGGDEQRLIGTHQPNEVLCSARSCQHGGGGVQSDRRDFPEAERRAPAVREGGIVQGPRSRSAFGIQPDLQSRSR